MNNLPLLTIVIPCFNEEANIPILLERFNSSIMNYKKAHNSCEIQLILVNNGSLDHSQDVLNECLPKYSFATSVKLLSNLGYGNGILYGLNYAKSRFIGWTHADLQTDPNDILKALQIIKASRSVNLFIKGKRVGRSLADQFFSDGMSIFESILFMLPLYEINAQPTIFNRNLLDSNINPPKDFSLDLYIYIQAILRQFRIERFNVLFSDRIYGTSSWNLNINSKIKFIIRTIMYSIKLRFFSGSKLGNSR